MIVQDCNSLELPNNLQTIGDMAFYGCVKLTNINIPPSVRTIGEYGVGFTVAETGESTVIPDFVLNVNFGSVGYHYARENGIGFHAKVSANLIMLVAVVLLMVILLVVGIVMTVKQNRLAKVAEQEQKEEEERLKRVAELQERRKQRKNQ